MDEIFKYACEAIVYVCAAVILTGSILVIKDYVKRRSTRKEEEDLVKYIKPMMVYMRVKGVDDFIFDCKQWQRKGEITYKARAMLKERYKALGDLGANGERDEAWHAIKNLPPTDKE